MRYLLYILVLIAVCSPFLTVHAQSVPGGNDSSVPGGNAPDTLLNNPIEADSLNELLAMLLNVLVQIGVVVLTVMIVYCGFLFVTAQGNEEKLRSARSALLWTVIGGLIILGAEVIAQAIEGTVQRL